MGYRARMVDEAGPDVTTALAPVAAAQRPASRLEPAVLLALALLGGSFAWWAWQEGAYFGVVLLPGTILLCAGAALLVRFAPTLPRLSLATPAGLALAALTALAVWAALSALWSPAPDVAIADGQRIGVYALLYGLGLGLAGLLGARLGLALVPLAAAGAFAGAVTVISLATSDTPRDLLEIADGTLDSPIGYRNANAAFFALATFPALGLATDRARDWRLRAAALATATLCIDLFLLSQSRGSMPAIVIALVVYMLAAPQRMRALSWLALAVLPALGVLPPLISLYDASADGVAGVADEMNRAGVTAAVTVAIALVLGALAARGEGRLPGLGSVSSAANRRVAQGMVAIATLTAVAAVVAIGDPVDWVEQRADEFRAGGSPDLSDRTTRFTFHAGSDRYDLWRVGLDDAVENPVLGTGGGGFQYTYVRKREVAAQTAHDAHSVELEVLSELGVVGFALLAIALVAATAGTLRARRAGPAAAGLSAVALAVGSYWLVHASVDWFWPYPALTAPVLALAGSACAPALRAPGRAGGRRRGLLIVALAALALSAIPPWLAERHVNNAYAGWRTDLEGAYEDLDRAQQLNRLSDAPLLAEGAIARSSDDPERALSAFREAAELRPEEWATHYLLAETLADDDPSAARDEIRLALELNPLSDRVQALAARLGVDPARAD